MSPKINLHNVSETICASVARLAINSRRPRTPHPPTPAARRAMQRRRDAREMLARCDRIAPADRMHNDGIIGGPRRRRSDRQTKTNQQAISKSSYVYEILHFIKHYFSIFDEKDWQDCATSDHVILTNAHFFFFFFVDRLFSSALVTL